MLILMIQMVNHLNICQKIIGKTEARHNGPGNEEMQIEKINQQYHL